MLPFFFRHYDPIVDTYFVADHDSTDQSRAILNAHPNAITTEFECSETSFVESARTHYNECWKASRGKADWVIVCNIDEHFYHPDLLTYLNNCKSQGISLIRPKGYNMISASFPVANKSLESQVTFGERDTSWDKPQLFDPNSIAEINFWRGRHRAAPTGLVKEDASRRVKLLHYKYMGIDYLSSRSANLEARMKPLDAINGLGGYAFMNEADKAERIIQKAKSNAVPVYSPFPLLIAAPKVVIRQSIGRVLRRLRKLIQSINATT